MNARRNALSLAAVMAATVLTGGAAILGITHTATVAAPATQSAALVQPAAPSAAQEEGD